MQRAQSVLLELQSLAGCYIATVLGLSRDDSGLCVSVYLSVCLLHEQLAQILVDNVWS